MNRRILRVLSMTVVAVVTCSCIQPSAEYVKADRSTYDVIGPAYRGYVGTDGRLTDEQKQRRRDLVESWRIRLEKAEEAHR